MKKKILFTLPMSILAIACAQQGTIRTMGCQQVSIPVCQGNPASPSDININVASGLTIAPKNVCAQPNTDIDVKITPKNSLVTVATVPKNPANWWMYGINFPDSGGFTISVPEKLPAGDYDYLVVTGDGKCVDPRIQVD